MAEQPLDIAIPRFKTNEDRFDRFTNGTDTQTYTASDGENVPSLRKFLKDKNAEINTAADGILAASVTAKNDAVTAKNQAVTAKDQAVTAKNAAEAAAAALPPITNGTMLVDESGSRTNLTFEQVRKRLGTTVAHGVTHWDLAISLVGDGVADDTTAFLVALNAAKAAGISKIISSNPLHRYKIVEAELPGSFEFILNGAGFVADFNNLYSGTCATVLKTSTEANAYNVTIRDALIDGRNTGANPSGSGNRPLLYFKGGSHELDRCDVRRGANRGTFTGTTYMDGLQGEVQFVNPRRVHIHDSYIGNSPGEQIQVLSDKPSVTQYPIVIIERCRFSKERLWSPGTQWSSSSVVLYKCAKTSYMADCVFEQHIKSAVNWFGQGTIERCQFYGVSDSQAIDFDEAASFGIDQITVRDCFIQNVIGGFAIRGSCRHAVFENIDMNRCQNGIYVEVQVTTSSMFTGVGVGSPRSMYNIFMRNITGNGNEVLDGTGAPVVNTLIKIKGVSQTQPATVYIEGTGNHQHVSGSDFPSANEEYGIDTENCYLFLRGTFAHGATSKVRQKGYSKFKAQDAQFFVASGQDLLTIDGGTIRDIVFEDVEVFGSIGAGLHVRLLNAPTLAGRLYRTRAGDITATTTGIPYTNNYTTTGTT